ncbi:alpha-L-fucosidase C-terminal domain-containing protein [Lentisphaera marina]|uniref:alpha-L-fucosidase C-terminal domain-containing protein n=1 Tax=Lentisphaera marina TaxID=1111041 RepID=UPI003B67F5B7
MEVSPDTKITMLGVDGELKFAKTAKGIEVILPQLTPTKSPCKDIFTLKISHAK